MIWPLIYPTHVQHNQWMGYSCEWNLIWWTHLFLLVPLLQALPSWGIPSGDLIQTLFLRPWRSDWRPTSSLNLSPRTWAQGMSLASPLLSHLNLSCRVGGFYNGCMLKAVALKLGSSRCFQSHQRRAGWAEAQLSTGACHIFLEWHFYPCNTLSFYMSFGESSVALKDSRGSRGTEQRISTQGYSNEVFFFWLINTNYTDSFHKYLTSTRHCAGQRPCSSEWSEVHTLKEHPLRTHLSPLSLCKGIWESCRDWGSLTHQ